MTDTTEPPATPSGRLDSLLTAVRMRTWIHRYAMRVLDALGHAPLMDPDSHIGPRTLEIGRDPIRILVFGAGLAIGYGVQTRADSFDGPLAREVAGLTGRGVVLENRAMQHVDLRRSVDSLGPAAAHTFHVAVWCPSFAEGMERVRLSSWRTELHAMIRGFRAESAVDLVLTCMPVPAGLHPAAVIARPWVHRLNRVIRLVADEWDGVVAVDTVPFTPAEIGKPITDAPYFAAVAHRIAPAVARRFVRTASLLA